MFHGWKWNVFILVQFGLKNNRFLHLETAKYT